MCQHWLKGWCTCWVRKRNQFLSLLSGRRVSYVSQKKAAIHRYINIQTKKNYKKWKKNNTHIEASTNSLATQDERERWKL